MDYQWTPGMQFFENKRKKMILKIILRIIKIDPNYPQTRIFRNMTQMSFCTSSFYLTLCKKLKKSDERILRYIEK